MFTLTKRDSATMTLSFLSLEYLGTKKNESTQIK